MSTAGKVLVALILLASLAWIALSAGVAQLDRNGNAALAKLAAEYASAEEGLNKAQVDIAKIKDETTVFQEGVDAQLTTIRSRLYDVEGNNSRLTEMVNRVEYQLATMQNTVKDGERLRDQRLAEKQDEEKALAAARAEVQELMDLSDKLTNQLESLRQEFKKTFDSNVDMVASAAKH